MKGRPHEDPTYYLEYFRRLRNYGKPEEHVWLANWRKFGFERSTIYVVSPDNSWPCKIGIANHGYSRVKSLQTSVWRPIKADFSAWTNTRTECSSLEKAVHRMLDEEGLWLHGEWFDMRPEQAVDAIRFQAAVTGIEINEVVEEENIIDSIKMKLHHLADLGIAAPIS